ncbi:uncharacterized protein BKA55DRAFT_578022 [Fusarium redolens]|uniref:CBF1-interacting co-repressor CIR N-terminal domain-containing protein n=1 Tax=Fusarium redolens TaxID=48865 RepID=A0A9P9GDP2_FUSRE|nr:uncharacterized protein BKA55DRAFT_578022 [Fusarium redolens]KAH7237640.1 hypothetical protein BKA55DRAFT_578022 [Fusarium redolens]
MPLHLLGKKSWNVYNADNIARVRRDEAAAKVAEEAEEQRMQEIDAQRRLAILRGEVPPPIEDDEPSKDQEPPVRDRDASQRTSMRRKRKRPGEDDTDFEMRIARENDNSALVRMEPEKKSTSSAPIVDHNGHIDLLGDEKSRAHAEKNEEAEKEAKKKKQSYEDQYTMRFSNATGKDGVLRPWYSQSDVAAPDASSKDVWGNQDPNRKERDAKRIVSNDPLAMMKKGASKVREIKQERKRFQEEREEELKQMRRDERHREKRRRRHHERDRSRERHRSHERDEERSPSRHERRHRSREGRHSHNGHADTQSRRHERHEREGSRHERKRYEESGERRERPRRDDESRKRDSRSSEGVGHERRRHHSEN